MSYCQHTMEPRVQPYWTYSVEAKPKKNISTIEDWVLSFNMCISVVAMRTPERVRDLLAYIIKASQDFQGSPWLEYDVHFRKLIANWGSARSAITDGSCTLPEPIPNQWLGHQWHRVLVLTKNWINSSRTLLLLGIGTPHIATPTRVSFLPTSGIQISTLLHSLSGFLTHIALDCPQQRYKPPPLHPQEQLSRKI